MAELQGDSEVQSSALLCALQDSGAEQIDPVRFAYLSALARRATEQPEPIRQWLTSKILREAKDMGARHDFPIAAEEQAEVLVSPLSQLLTYIGEHGHTPSGVNQPAIRPSTRPSSETRPAPAQELKSVAYFRDTWSTLSTEQQLTQTLAQAPENAGPMNSQHLVLRALTVMRDCAPEYLQGFMSYVDTLIWLEHASAIKPNTDRSPPTEGGKKKKSTKRESGNP